MVAFAYSFFERAFMGGHCGVLLSFPALTVRHWLFFLYTNVSGCCIMWLAAGHFPNGVVVVGVLQIQRRTGVDTGLVLANSKL